MRKILKTCTVLVLALAMVFGLSSIAYAAGSKSDVVEITKAVDKDGKKVTYKVSKSKAHTPLTEKIASEVLEADGIETVPASQLKVLWEKELTASKTPATFTFDVSGTKGKTLYVFHWNGSEWEYVDKGTGTSVTATFDDLSPVGIVMKLDKAPTPKTGDDSNIALWAGIMAVAAAGAAGTAIFRAKRNKEA